MGAAQTSESKAETSPLGFQPDHRLDANPMMLHGSSLSQAFTDSPLATRALLVCPLRELSPSPGCKHLGDGVGKATPSL